MYNASHDLHLEMVFEETLRMYPPVPGYIHKPLLFFVEVGIPGPKPKPIVGNLGLLQKFSGDERVFCKHICSAYGPVAGVFLGTNRMYIIADLDLFKEITVKQHDKFMDRMTQRDILCSKIDGKIYESLLTTKGMEWKMRRSVLSPAFSGYKIKLMEPFIKESTTRLAEKISAAAEKGETVDAVELYSKMSMEVILSTAFGRTVDVQGGKGGKGGKLLESAMTLFTAFTPAKEGDPETFFKMLQFLLLAFPCLEPLILRLVDFFEARKAADYLEKSADMIIEARKMKSNDSAKRKDLLQLMIDASDSETQRKLEKGEIVADSVGFMLAGYETTSTTLAFATYLLATNPEAQERLANEIHNYFEENPGKPLYEASNELQYLDMVIRETLRLYSPCATLFRMCTKDCVVKGVQFKKGAMVLMSTDAIHHDPNVWTNPDVFNPDRFTPKEKAKHHPCAHMPFGYGPRSCIGMRFALLEAKMALIEVVSNFRIILAPETKVPLEITNSLTLKPKHGVFVKFEPRRLA